LFSFTARSLKRSSLRRSLPENSLRRAPLLKALAGPPGAFMFGGSWISQGTSGRCGGVWRPESGGGAGRTEFPLEWRNGLTPGMGGGVAWP
jgi:hypothetical protein